MYDSYAYLFFINKSNHNSTWCIMLMLQTTSNNRQMKTPRRSNLLLDLSASGYDGQPAELIFSSKRRHIDENDTTIVTGRRVKSPSSRIQTNTLSNYFQPLQVGLSRKILGQQQRSTSSKIKCRKLNTSPTEEAGNTDEVYEHRVRRRAHRKNDRVP